MGCDRAVFRCSRCGCVQVVAQFSLEIPFKRPWHIRGRNGVRDYVASLGLERIEWVLALFIDDQFNLLSVQTVALGDEAGVEVNLPQIVCRGLALQATGMVLVHNHPSGLARASSDDLRVTRRLRFLANEMGLRLLDHLIVAGDQLVPVGDDDLVDPPPPSAR